MSTTKATPTQATTTTPIGLQPHQRQALDLAKHQLMNEQNASVLRHKFRAKHDHYKHELWQFFSLVDLLLGAGIAINHTTDAGLLTVSIGHVYDLAELIDWPLPDEIVMMLALDTLAYPRPTDVFVNSPLWPDAKRVSCRQFVLVAQAMVTRRDAQSACADLEDNIQHSVDLLSGVSPSEQLLMGAQAYIGYLVGLRNQVKHIRTLV